MLDATLLQIGEECAPPCQVSLRSQLALCDVKERMAPPVCLLAIHHSEGLYSEMDAMKFSPSLFPTVAFSEGHPEVAHSSCCR